MPQVAAVIVSYSGAEAAKLLGVSRQTIYNDCRDGKLLAHRSGRGTVIFAADLLEYVLQYRGGRGIPEA